MKKQRSLRTERARQHFILDKIIPYIKRMSADDVKDVAFEQKLPEQEECQSIAMIVVRQSGRMPELSKYRRFIREALNDKFEDWERELASELHCIATSIIISDLVGETFVGDEDSYDYAGVPIEVTEDLVEMVSHTWNQKTALVAPIAV